MLEHQRTRATTRVPAQIWLQQAHSRLQKSNSTAKSNKASVQVQYIPLPFVDAHLETCDFVKHFEYTLELHTWNFTTSIWEQSLCNSMLLSRGSSACSTVRSCLCAAALCSMCSKAGSAFEGSAFEGCAPWQVSTGGFRYIASPRRQETAVDEPEAYKAQVSDMDEPQTFRAHWIEATQCIRTK